MAKNIKHALALRIVKVKIVSFEIKQRFIITFSGDHWLCGRILKNSFHSYLFRLWYWFRKNINECYCTVRVGYLIIMWHLYGGGLIGGASYKINQFAAIPRLSLTLHRRRVRDCYCIFITRAVSLLYFYQDANREVTTVQLKF